MKCRRCPARGACRSLTHPMQVGNAPQDRIDVPRERDGRRVADGETGIEPRHHVVDRVVQRDDVLDRRREVRRCDNHPRRIGNSGRGPPCNLTVARTGPSPTSSHQPSLSAKCSRCSRKRLRPAMTAQDDQAPGGIGQQVAELHVDGLHERAAQLLHRLIDAADAGTGIDDQVALRLPALRRPVPSSVGATALRFARWTSHSTRASAR